jgi:hypothetical protein
MEQLEDVPLEIACVQNMRGTTAIVSGILSEDKKGRCKNYTVRQERLLFIKLVIHCGHESFFRKSLNSRYR